MVFTGKGVIEVKIELKFKIYFEYPTGEQDNIILTGETVEEIMDKANIEMAKRGAKGLWSERVGG